MHVCFFFFRKINSSVDFSISVCRFWRTIILRKWNKITKFTYADSGKSSRYFPGKSPVIIPDQDAKKIALYAAKFCNDLTLKVLRNVKDVVFSFGSFVYKVLIMRSNAVCLYYCSKLS